MKVKRVLKFYFYADSLEMAFNNLIINNARQSAQPYSGERYAEKICSLLDEKEELSKLWNYLGCVLVGLSEEERDNLESYAKMRFGIKKLDDEKRKGIKRAAVKFMRRARRLESFEKALGILNKYYTLINYC